MVAGGSNELDPAPPGDFLDQADISAEVKRAHLDHRPHAFLVRLAHGRHRFLQQARAVEEFRVRVAQAGGVGAHMLVTQGKAQVLRLHWTQHGIHSWHDTPSLSGFDSSMGVGQHSPLALWGPATMSLSPASGARVTPSARTSTPIPAAA